MTATELQARTEKAQYLPVISTGTGVFYVESEEGKGTEFKIYLPQIITEIKKEEIAEVEPDSLPTGNETILLVDDEDSIRDFLAEILSEQGYKVIEATNGEEGLQVFKGYNEKIDLLISDITMPKMSGPELATKLRELQPKLKALFISGNVGNEYINEQTADSKTSFLQKPFTYDSIISKVREILDIDKVE